MKKLGMEPRDILRKKEKEYKEAGLDDETLSNKKIIEAMTKYPKIIERPIILSGAKAVLGRPPEKALEII